MFSLSPFGRGGWGQHVRIPYFLQVKILPFFFLFSHFSCSFCSCVGSSHRRQFCPPFGRGRTFGASGHYPAPEQAKMEEQKRLAHEDFSRGRKEIKAPVTFGMTIFVTAFFFFFFCVTCQKIGELGTLALKRHNLVSFLHSSIPLTSHTNTHFQPLLLSLTFDTPPHRHSYLLSRHRNLKRHVQNP